MKWIYIGAVLFLLLSCSKERINTCGLVGEWLCCEPTNDCTIFFQGQPITEKWTFEEDGDFFIDDLIPRNGKWDTDGNCTELLFDPGTEDEGKLKIDINGDELVVHYGSVVGDRTFCRR